MAKPPSLTRSRHKARNLAVQALYQWQITGQDRGDIVSQFFTDQDMNETVTEYFKELVSQVSARAQAIDSILAPLLDRPIEQLDPVESAVLRIGVYELEHRPDVPYRVVINEAIEAAKLFGAEESYKYINGVLDKLKGAYRAQEIELGKTP
ncbi:MAG: transcription antitermination factor NusB [Gammaproteobacteria bacterium]|nr:transcription antitermination factor NusB [bacterium AH-315-E07]PCH61128.1 MAG: transcription antitermination factor NusB [Gammaproteobacteria bacterium]